jgi:hypothetical protein
MDVERAVENNRRVANDPNHPLNQNQQPQQEGAMPLLPKPFAGNLSEADDAVSTIMAWLYSRIAYVKGRVPEDPVPPPPPPPAPQAAGAAAGAGAGGAPLPATAAVAGGAGAAVAGAGGPDAVATQAAAPAAVPAADAAAEAGGAPAVAVALEGPASDQHLISELQVLEARKKEIIARLAASAGLGGNAAVAVQPARRMQAGAAGSGLVLVNDYSANEDGDPDQA